jgi:hypothetical protein
MILGEYHHVDYKEKRRKQLEKDQENRDNSSDDFNSHLSIQNKYQLSISFNSYRKFQRTDEINSYLTMAKAVHFRNSNHCFIVDGIDISSRFQYDRKIIQNTCLRFHSHQLDNNSKQTIQSILVLCTQKMNKIYRLLESLLKPYLSPNISIIYVTFDQITPFLIANGTLQKESFALRNSHHTSPSTTNQNMASFQSVELEKELNTDNIPTSTDKFDLSNEEFVVNCLRSSSLILIFMKHLNEIYLTAVCLEYSSIFYNHIRYQ